MTGALLHGALVAAFAVALTSCTSEAREKTSSADDAPSAPTATEFASERHSYHLEVPAEWEVTEYDGTWTDLSQFSPGSEVVGEDVVSAPDQEAFLVSNSMAIPEGMSPDDWMAELERLVGSGPPGCEGSKETGELAGEPTTVIRHECGDMSIVGRNLTHEGRGYYFTMGYPTGDSATEATLKEIVSSIGFAD